MRMPDEVRAALVRLEDALVRWERSGGPEVALVMRGGGVSHRSLGGKPEVPDWVSDGQLLEGGATAKPERLDREWMNRAAGALAKEIPDGHGFIILVAPFTDSPGANLAYTSNMVRACAVKVVRSWLYHAGCEEGWMKHL